MKKNLIMAVMCLTTYTATAQETYENAQLATEDLNGTARYIGMGGAMEALGADISTMSTNPAGIGLFRKSWVGASGGVSFQKGSGNHAPSVLETVTSNNNRIKENVTNADFNQLGFIYSTQCGQESWFNLGLNYHKSRNFNMIANAMNTLDGLSSVNYASIMRINAYNESSMLDQLNWVTVNENLQETYIDSEGNEVTQDGYKGADAYFSEKENNGYISEFDVNFSGNFDNRVFLGVSIGLKDVHYNSATLYNERLKGIGNDPDGYYTLIDYRKIRGTGLNIKFGIIVRPIEESPFRIGAYVHTPTWYDLTCDFGMETEADYYSNGTRYYGYKGDGWEYKYKMTTPWKFGLSLGHTINNIVALGATYEYADYSFVKNKIVYDDDHSIYAPDTDMDQNTKYCLRSVSTAKFGVEVKPVPEVALRMGYNYVSPLYHEDASKDISIPTNEEYGSNGAYASTYDYTNWKATHRVTFGVGFMLTKNLNLDLAYQYSTQKGEYHPFPNYQWAGTDLDPNIGTPTQIKNERHQINATLGYRF